MKRKKTRPETISKSREYVTADFGKALPLGDYNGTSENLPLPGTSYSGPDNAARVTQMLTAFYKQPRSFTQYSPASSGKETFFATNFPAPKWNSVDHTISLRNFSLPHSIFIPSGNQYWSDVLYSSHHHSWSNVGAASTIPNNGVEASDFTRARAWATMQPRFESDFKALNFLFELKDFKDIGGNMANLLRGKNPLTDSLGRLGKDPRVKVYRPEHRNISPTKQSASAAEAFDGGANSVAEAWLLNSMAVQPLLKDIAAFSAAIASEYLLALEKFKDDGKGPNTRHYSELLVNNESVYAERPMSFPYNLKYLHQDYVKFTGSLQYTYKYNLTNCMEAFARYWGLTGTAEEFWNMLPFSFLLDYVFQVAKSLKLSEKDTNLDLTVVNYSESHLRYAGASMGFAPYATGVPMAGYILDGKYCQFDGRYRPFMGYYGSRYTRVNNQPMKLGLTLPQWKTPKLNQWYNIGALAKTLLF